MSALPTFVSESVTFHWPEKEQFILAEQSRKAKDSQVVRQSGSKYMASTTLSDPNIEKVILSFLLNKDIRSAAKEANLSVKSVTQYYGLLLERLIAIGYYRPEIYFKQSLVFGHEPVFNAISAVAKEGHKTSSRVRERRKTGNVRSQAL